MSRCLDKSVKNRPGFAGLREELRGIYINQTGKMVPTKDDPEPLSAEDHNAKGAGFDRLGHHEKAIECYARVIALDPHDQRFYLNRANAKVFKKMDELSEAVEDYRTALHLLLADRLIM